MYRAAGREHASPSVFGVKVIASNSERWSRSAIPMSGTDPVRPDMAATLSSLDQITACSCFSAIILMSDPDISLVLTHQYAANA